MFVSRVTVYTVRVLIHKSDILPAVSQDNR